MDSDIFRAGVRPGSPTSSDEIKMLVCYILSALGQTMTFEQLHEALGENNLVNYFELVRAVEGLKRTGHLGAETLDAGGSERFTVTELGTQAAEIFQSELPPAVREKALQSADRLLRRNRRESEVRVDIRPENGGFRVELAIPEAEGELVTFTLHAPTREECDRIRRRFLNDPLFIYKGVVALLTGDDQVLERIFPQKELLF